MFLIYQAPSSVSWDYIKVGGDQAKLGKICGAVEDADFFAPGDVSDPRYVSMFEDSDETWDGADRIIPAVRITEDIIFETTAAVSMSGVKVGDKVCLVHGGMEVNASTTDGVAEIVWMEGTAAGSKVRVRFS